MQELEKLFSELRELFESARRLEEAAYRAYEESISRVRSRISSRILISIAAETYLHLKLFEALTQAISDIQKLFSKHFAKPIEGSARDIEEFYQALEKHLRIEESATKLYSYIINRVEHSFNSLASVSLDSLQKLLASIVRAILDSEYEHHRSLEELKKMLR